MARLSPKLRFEVFRRDNFACTYCGAKGDGIALHADHVVPRAKGGPDTLDNLTTACQQCNAGKSATEVIPGEAEATVALAGMRFVSFYDTGRARWQGYIEAELSPTLLLARFYSWLDGAPNHRFVLPVETLADTFPGKDGYPEPRFILFTSDEELRDWIERHPSRVSPADEQPRGEFKIEVVGGSRHTADTPPSTE